MRTYINEDEFGRIVTKFRVSAQLIGAYAKVKAISESGLVNSAKAKRYANEVRHLRRAGLLSNGMRLIYSRRTGVCIDTGVVLREDATTVGIAYFYLVMRSYGSPVGMIASRVGCSRQKVYRALRKCGIEVSAKGSSRMRKLPDRRTGLRKVQ